MTKPSAASSAWKEFLKLQVLELDPFFPKHLQEYGTDAEAYMTDQPRSMSLSKEQRNELYKTLGDVLVTAERDTTMLEKSKAFAYARKLFATLAQYDIYKILFPIPSKLERFKPLARKEVQDFLERAGAKEISDERIERVQLRTLESAKLSCLCDEFGSGCLFLLASLLSPTLLKRGFGNDSSARNAAFAHLSQLNLQQKAAEMGTNELGQNIREYFTRSLRKDVETQKT